jgi:hypothetical protein
VARQILHCRAVHTLSPAQVNATLLNRLQIPVLGAVQLGTLPPQFFTVTISTVGENMSQLMLSVLMTGYMFRNAQYRCGHSKPHSLWRPAAAACINKSVTSCRGLQCS